MSQLQPWTFSGLVLRVKELGGSAAGTQDLHDSQISSWPESSALGNTAFQGFLLFNLTHGSCVSDLDAASGGSQDPLSPSSYTNVLIIGLHLRSLGEAVGWCNPPTVLPN